MKNRWIHRKKLALKNRWIHRKKLALKIFGGSVDPPWIHRKKISVDRWTSVDQKIELGKYSSIHVKKIQRIEKSVDPQKKTCFSNFRWIGGSVDQKTELGERKKNCYFFLCGSTEKTCYFCAWIHRKKLAASRFSIGGSTESEIQKITVL